MKNFVKKHVAIVSIPKGQKGRKRLLLPPKGRESRKHLEDRMLHNSLFLLTYRAKELGITSETLLEMCEFAIGVAVADGDLAPC